MAQKRSTKRKTTRRRNRKTQKKGFNLAKFTLGLFILIVLGYGALAIWEGKLVIDEVSQFEFFDEENTDGADTEKKDDPKPKDKGSDDRPNTVDPLDRFKDFDADAFDLYFTKAFDFGWPKYNTNETVIERPYYTLRYSAKDKQSMWVAYSLHQDSLVKDALDIREEFKKDPRVRNGAILPDAYQGSRYVMGQIAPSSDFHYDAFALSQSYYMSNVSPQNPEFNEGLWLALARQTREWAKENQEIHIVAGPWLTNDLESINGQGITIPRSFYKIILDIQKPQIKAIAYLVPNEPTDLPLSNYEISIDRLEEFTGLDFFPTLPDELEDYLESGYTARFWQY